MKNLIIRTLTGFIFVGIIVASFFINAIFFEIILFLILTGCNYEYLSIVKKRGYSPQKLLSLVVSAVAFIAVYYFLIQNSLSVFVLLILLLLTMMTVELYRGKDNSLLQIAISVFPFVWITVPVLIILIWFHFNEANKNILLALFIIIWIYDTLAYCIGSIFGKRKLFEKVSPNKSWEGFLGSLIITASISTIFYYISWFETKFFANPAYWIGFAITIIISSTLGDLFESLVKRECNTKDSGSILPGHGGLLDRFDSFLFAAPAGLLYIFFISQILN